jgi:mannose-6-phosphate isomerase
MPGDHGFPPLIFETIYKEKVWGGRALQGKLNKNIPCDVNIGESWELSAVPGDESKSLSPPYAGKTLPFIFEKEKERLVGNGRFPSFPLLYKFIDSNEKLSVQVHPADREAKNGVSPALGKTECWFIVDAKPGAQLICGFRKGVGLADVKDGVERGNLPQLCNYVPIKSGDVVFVPAGTVHALLDGVLIYEMQQTSDTTFRLYDWGRTDKNGNSRPLHVKESLQALDMNFHDKHKISPITLKEEKGVFRFLRVVCRYFALEEYRVEASSQFVLESKSSFQVLTVLDGAIMIPGFCAIGKGQTVLLPASIGRLSIALDTSAHLLASYVPDIAAEIVKPLLRQGVSREALIGLGGNPFRNDVMAALKE